MAKTYTGAEFLTALAEGSLREPIRKEGMVKQDESDAGVILFSEGRSCLHWTKVPVELIEKVDYLGTVRCRDHEHPVVRLYLKEPPGENKVAGVFAELARHSQSPTEPRRERLLAPPEAPQRPPMVPQPRELSGRIPRRGRHMLGNRAATTYYCTGCKAQCQNYPYYVYSNGGSSVDCNTSWDGCFDGLQDSCDEVQGGPVVLSTRVGTYCEYC